MKIGRYSISKVEIFDEGDKVTFLDNEGYYIVINFMGNRTITPKVLHAVEETIMPDPYLTFILRSDDCKCNPKFNFKKTVDESFNVGVDFLLDLPEDVFITSAVATAEDLRTGLADGTVTGTATVELDDDGNRTLVCIPVLAGTLGKSYRIKLLTTLDDTFTVLENCLKFKVEKCEDSPN